MTLRQAAEKLLKYRKEAGPLGYQLEKADDYHRMLRAALDSPDIADELAAALRKFADEYEDVMANYNGNLSDWESYTNARELLARYDAQKQERDA